MSWPVKQLGDVLQRTESLDPRSLGKSNFCYIDVSSVSNKTLSIEDVQTLAVNDAPSRARRFVRNGDVLFATIRPTLRRIAIVPEDLDKEICSTGFLVLRPKPELSNRFVFYFLQSQRFMAAMEELQKGASYPAVTDAEVRMQRLPIPPLAEQHRIVALLDEAFAGIAIAKANAEQNLRNARDVLSAKLESTVGEAFDRHGSLALSGFATDITDGDHMPPPKSSEGIPFITIGNISKATREIDFSDTFRVPQSYMDGLKANRRPRKGDVLYTVTGSFGIPVLIADDRSFCFQRHIGLIRPNAAVNSSWLQYVLMSPQVFKQAEEGATGTAQKTVSLKTLRGLRVPNSPSMEQDTTAEILRRVEEETRILQSLYTRKLAALDELKQSLLQRAFSGQL